MRFSLLIFLCCCQVGYVAAQSDIRSTKHNLSGAAGGAGESLSDPGARIRLEREVCVFCHTPTADGQGVTQGVEGGAAVPAPLWQPNVGGEYAFELFDDIGRAVEVGESGPVGSTSVACLSCHDATQAFGIGLGIGGGDSDHPYGVPYRGSNTDAFDLARVRGALAQGENPYRMATRVTGDKDFRPANTAIVNRRQVWWASSSAGSQRTKSDLPLYPRRARSDDENSPMVPFVECTSCHDPHTTQSRFLRVDNNQGRLCLSCHVK